MRSFFAILKDSFREAVDGFVIYAMLGLSVLVTLVVASLSFTPAPPDQAFDKIVGGFQMVFPDRGQSRVMTLTNFNTTYSAADVRPDGGGYKLRVTAKAGAPGRVAPADARPADGKPADGAAGTDSFRETVAVWMRPPGRAKAVEQAGKKVEFGEAVAVPADEMRAVTDADMEAFVAGQFAAQAGIEATARRVPTDPPKAGEQPTYAFDVTAGGGSSVRGWPHTVKIFFGAFTVARNTSLGGALYLIEDQLLNGLGAGIALLIAMIITAFFIPNMLRKGSVDLLISKPIGRVELLVYKYVGGLTFIFLVSAVAVGGVWLALAVRSGHWDPTFLVVVPVLTFTFAILYSVSTLVAVVTRSPIAAMLLTVAFAVFLWVVGTAKSIVDRLKVEFADRGSDDRVPDWVSTLVDTLNNVLPRYKDLDKLTSKLIADGTLTPAENRMYGLAQMDLPSWASTFGVSVAFIAVMLGLSAWWFSRRDY